MAPHGCLWELGPALQQNGSHFLVRVKENLKVKRRRRLADGSWLVSVAVKDPSTRKKIGSLILREIHATMHVEGEATPRPIRLWTSLLDPEEHPALALVELYTKRWEEELFSGNSKPMCMEPTPCCTPKPWRAPPWK